MFTPPDIHALLEQIGSQLGFALLGITPAELPTDTAYLHQWLADGKQGEMGYLAEHVEIRNDPQKLLPGAKTVICLADRYACTSSLETTPPIGRIARYAWGDDYHKVLKKRLFKLTDAMKEHWPDAQFRAAVDTAPVPERLHAARAGLGWIGKNTLLIHPKIGSWFLLGEIFTTLDLATTNQTANQPMADHCGTCTRCLDACPTDCLTPYQIDARKCISYLTLEHRNAIDPALFEPMGDWLAGCDICQEVCPHNPPTPKMPLKTASPSGNPTDTQASLLAANTPVHPRYTPRTPAPGLNLLEVLNWTTESRQQAFIGSALKRMKLDMVKRNAIIAAGNHLAKHDHPALLARLHALAVETEEPDLVRQTAQTVLQRLNAPALSPPQR